MLEKLATTFNIHSAYFLFILVLLITVVSFFLCKWIVSILQNRFAKTKTPWDDAFIYALKPPLFFLIVVLGVSVAFSLLETRFGVFFRDVVLPSRNVAIILLLAWLLFRFISTVQSTLIKQKQQQNTSVNMASIEGVVKLCYVSVSVIAIIMVLQALGFSVSGLLAFGGVGGIVLGFAAKDMLSNFFGGLMIYLDKPFSIGDWVRSPDRSMEGIVENIGWRVTRIKNFQAVPIYIPNSTFSNVALENVSRMTNRQIYETVGVRYEDASAVHDIVTDVRAYLQGHAGIDQSRTLIVNLTTFAPSSLDFFIYCFSKATTGVDFYAVKQEILLKILEIIDKHGAECAFPTTTMHVADIPNIVARPTLD